MDERAYRLAAVRLAALHPADRRWLVKRLPAAWRRALQPLIKDLLRIGGSDQRIYREVYEQSHVERATGDEATAGHSFAALPRRRLHLELDQLPADWAAAALLTEPQSVVTAYADGCDLLRRDALLDAHARLSVERPKPRLLQALKEALHRRCSAGAESDAGDPRRQDAAA